MVRSKSESRSIKYIVRRLSPTWVRNLAQRRCDAAKSSSSAAARGASRPSLRSRWLKSGSRRLSCWVARPSQRPNLNGLPA